MWKIDIHTKLFSWHTVTAAGIKPTHSFIIYFAGRWCWLLSFLVVPNLPCVLYQHSPRYDHSFRWYPLASFSIVSLSIFIFTSLHFILFLSSSTCFSFILRTVSTLQIRFSESDHFIGDFSFTVQLCRSIRLQLLEYGICEIMGSCSTDST